MRLITTAVLWTMLVTSAFDAGAATFVVNSTADTTDGTCAAVAGGCTLREAIEAAVALGGRDTIAFDPAVFTPDDEAVRITLASPLPIIADASGTVVDGAGASVRITGGAGATRGLVFASAAGVPLTKVTVANVSLETFSDAAIHLCAGAYPNCDAEVASALIQNVFADPDGGDGISLQGQTIKKARVIDSVVRDGRIGIRLHGPTSIVGSRVQGSSVTHCTSDGILFQTTTQTGSVVVDSTVAHNGGHGVRLDSEGGAILNAKLTNVVADENTFSGVYLAADGSVAATVSNAVASQNLISGIHVFSGDGSGGAKLKNVVADANGSQGIDLKMASTGTQIVRARVVANTGIGINSENASALKLKDVIAADNLGGGAVLRAIGGTAERVHASANEGNGITLTTGGGNTVKKSRTNANGMNGGGISIFDDSSGNTVQKNVAFGNGTDLFDGSPFCDSNSWTGNVFRTRGQSCIH